MKRGNQAANPKLLHALAVILTFVFVALIYVQFFTGISIHTRWLRAYDSNTADNIGFAVSEYFTEYQRFPGVDSASGDDTDFETNERFITMLLGTAPSLQDDFNPRGIAFFTASEAKHDPVSGRFHSGIKLHPNGKGELFDNYGNFYRVRVDGNRDGSINSPIDNLPVSERVLVWSAGRDGDFGTWKDNIKTW